MLKKIFSKLENESSKHHRVAKVFIFKIFCCQIASKGADKDHINNWPQLKIILHLPDFNSSKASTVNCNSLSFPRRYWYFHFRNIHADDNWLGFVGFNIKLSLYKYLSIAPKAIIIKLLLSAHSLLSPLKVALGGWKTSRSKRQCLLWVHYWCAQPALDNAAFPLRPRVGVPYTYKLRRAHSRTHQIETQLSMPDVRRPAALPLFLSSRNAVGLLSSRNCHGYRHQ